MNESDDRIVQILKKSIEWVSGEQIGAELNISRSAVSKHINQLRSNGYHIESSSRRGYLFGTAPNLPCAAEVTPLLTTQFIGRPLLHFHEVDSTNRVASQEAQKAAREGTVVVAEGQSSGRGRLQRHWHSPAGSNLYFSIILRPKVQPYCVSQLPLLAGMAVLKALEQILPTLNASVKWPNDIIVGQRKLCGILCESEAEADLVHYVIIGIGLNVNTRVFPADLKTVATSLQIEQGTEASRPVLLAGILNAFERDYDLWKDVQSLEMFLPFLNAHSLLQGREVIVQNVRRTICGQGAGISADGELLINTPQGILPVTAGDVTLKKW